MSGKKYTEEFKIEAVKQVTERGRPVMELAVRLAVRLGVSSDSLYQWAKRYVASPAERQKVEDQRVEMKRPRTELQCVTEERDISPASTNNAGSRQRHGCKRSNPRTCTSALGKPSSDRFWPCPTVTPAHGNVAAGLINELQVPARA